MRFSFIAIASVAVALAAVSTHAAVAGDAGVAVQGVADTATDALDEFGNPIEFIDTLGDHDFDDDDDDDDGETDATEVQPVRRNRKHKHGKKHGHKHRSKKHKKSTHYSKLSRNSRMMDGDTQITWYASQDLKNPQCGDGSWNPTNNAHIGAVMYGWNGGPKCGEFVHLCKKDRCLRVRIVDKCAGCKQGHVDLTKSAFKQLDPDHSLDTGVVRGLKLYTTAKPSPWDRGLFGPLRLKN